MGRSLISLFIYAALFYFLFDRNIAYIAAVLLVLLIHEFGHFFAMKLYNYQNVKLFIIPLMGAFVSGKKQDISQRQMSIIILAGPVPGLIIGVGLYIMNSSLHNESIKMLANVFLFINFFNLLPIYPLDGGRFLENLFIRTNFGIRMVFTILSIMLLFILLLFTGNFILIIVPVLMALELVNESKNQKIREYLEQEKINYFTEYNDLPDKSYWLIRDCILFAFAKKYNGVQPGLHQYSVAEPLLIRHVMGILKPNFNHDMSALQKAGFLSAYLLFLIGLPVVSFILLF
jgi:Zn-dependent protease